MNHSEMQLGPTDLREKLCTALFQTLSVLAPERFARYKCSDDQSLDVPIARYLYNTALCEALYPTLNAAEVLLKNRINNVLSVRYGEKWFDKTDLLQPQQANAVEKARAKIRDKGKHATANQVVAELNFGFWTSLLTEPYWQHFMQALNGQVFPNFPAGPRKRSVMARPWNEARVLRNRAFHNEPVWCTKDLGEQHCRLVNAMGWIDKACVQVLMVNNRFQQVLELGIEPHRHALSTKIESCLGPQTTCR